MNQQTTGIDARIALYVDGAEPVTTRTMDAVRAVCEQVEDGAFEGPVVVLVSGAPDGGWAEGLALAQVNKWERVLRRLECLPVPTVAIAQGSCGGPALDALLATDYRIAAGPVRLAMPAASGAVWPGMALYRLVHQASSPAAARRAVLFGADLDTGTALDAQLLDEAAADLDEALAIVGKLVGGLSGEELAVRRRLLFEAGTTAFDEALGAHLAACDRMLRRVAADTAKAAA
jgi:isomerase DpgB